METATLIWSLGLISDQIVAFENLVPAAVDCNGNGIGDDCEIGAALKPDWDGTACWTAARASPCSALRTPTRSPPPGRA